MKTVYLWGVKGDYRVKNVMIYNRETKAYEPIDPQKTYCLGGINYLLRNDGNGLCMFDEDRMIVDYVGQDYVILADYIKSFAKDGEYARVNSKNCPLFGYEGFLLNYEEPTGAGRIKIIVADR